MDVILSKLNIGFNSEVKVVERNEFEIFGDISIKVRTDDKAETSNLATVDRLRVVYNHDGLLEHIYNGEPCVPDSTLLFRDVETTSICRTAAKYTWTTTKTV